MKTPVLKQSTAQEVETARRELLAAFSNPAEIGLKVAAYTAAVKRHRESIFADALQEDDADPALRRLVG